MHYTYDKFLKKVMLVWVGTTGTSKIDVASSVTKLSIFGKKV